MPRRAALAAKHAEALGHGGDAGLETIVALLVLVVALAPAVRVAGKKPVWSELRARPLLTIALLLATSAAAFMILGSGPGVIEWLPAASVGALLLASFAYLRARPSFGRSRGLPPGSLGLATSLDAITDEDFYARSAARWGPVFKMAQFHRPVACVADLALGLEVLESQRAHLVQSPLPFGRLCPGNYIEFMNEEPHARYRGILRSALSGRVIAGCKDGIECVVREQLAQLAGRDEGRGVAPEAFLERIAVVGMLHVIFGIGVHDPRIGELQRLFDDLGSPRAFSERRPEGRVETFAALTGIVRAAAEQIRLQHASGPIPEKSVLSEILRADAAHLEDETLIGNLVLIVHVTRSNVRGLLGWVLKEHVDHPQFAQRIRQAARDTTEGASRVEALATNFVSETLRMHQSEYFYREVVNEIRIGPHRVPKGWLLRVCVRECHDDPVVFPEPSAFNPERFAGRHYSKTEYCPFGHGAHSCFGAGLAIMIARALITALAIDFDARGVSDGPAERQGNRHWSHWRPSRSLRVALRSASGRVQ